MCAPANAKRRNVAAPTTTFEFFDSFRILTPLDATAAAKGLRKIEEILIHAGDAVDLNRHVPGQPRRLHRSPRRCVAREVTPIDLVHLCELAHIL